MADDAIWPESGTVGVACRERNLIPVLKDAF
jgi:hypothetical protein